MNKIIPGIGLLFIFGCAHFGFLKQASLDIPNFYQVDDILYRGGQPGQKGLDKLKSLGIKTIIRLRQETDTLSQEMDSGKGLGMNFYNLPMSIYKRPSDDQVLVFLEIVLNRDNQPIFVHCDEGKDRTGAIVAMYRVVVCGWTIKEAYKEAKKFGFWPYRGEAELKNFIHQLKDKTSYFKKAKELIK